MKSIDKITIMALVLSVLFTIVGYNMLNYKKYYLIMEFYVTAWYLFGCGIIWALITLTAYFMLRMKEPLELKRKIGLIHFSMLVVVAAGY